MIALTERCYCLLGNLHRNRNHALVYLRIFSSLDFLPIQEDDRDKGNYMFTHRHFAAAAVLLGLSAGLASAQSVVSAHSGTLHYFDGAVTIDGNRAEAKVGKFLEIKENSVLHTGQGRAEVLLTPGVFLRLGENTEIKMLDNRLLSTRVEVLSGSVMVESDDPEMSVKNPVVTLIYKDYQIQPVKFGIFEITSEPSQLRVFKGQASVQGGANRVTVKDGHLMPFSAALLTEKFDEKQADDLYLWARDRSAYLSAANMSSARSLATAGAYGFGSGYGAMYGGARNGFSGNWYYNSFLNMYTYMPYGGTLWSPFGYGYFSPYTIGSYYAPGNYYWSGGGGSRAGAPVGVPLTNIGTSSLAAAQVSRIGSGGANAHPTLGSPVRNGDGAGSPTNSANSGYRGGFDSGAAFRGNSNPGFNSVNNNQSNSVSSNSSAGFSPAVASAPAAAPAAGNVGGGARGR